MSKLNIILYGRRNTGKTSALIKLVKLLANNPAVSAGIDGALKNRNGRFKDARFIVEIDGNIILVGTAGDSWGVCRGNADLFEGDYSSLLDIYLVNGTSFRALNTDEKGSYKSMVKQARVCISACSPTNLKNGAIKALHAYSETALMSYTRQLWVRSDDKYQSTAKANELLSIINEFLSQL